MNFDTFEGLDQRERNVLLIFRELQPQISRRPHCLFRIDGKTLHALRSVVCAPFGVWNGLLPDAGRRECGAPGTEWPLIEGFCLWAEPQNQAEAIEFRDRTDTGHFCMLIDAATPAESLKRLWASAPSPPEQQSVSGPGRPRNPSEWLMEYWGDYLDWLNTSIDELNWACVGVSGYSGLDYGLFVTRERDSVLVATLTRLLMDMERDVAKVELKDNRAAWIGPAALR